MSSFPKTVPSPNAALTDLYRRTPGYIKFTFAAAFVLGLLTHMFVLTNQFSNHDDLGHFFGTNYGTFSGRWLLPLVCKLDGDFSMRWPIGILCLLCLAGTACFTVSLLRIHHPAGCLVTAGLLVTFPTVASNFFYMFSADAYLFSLLLAAFGAYAAVRWGIPGSFLAAGAVLLSMGIYQSYFGVTAALMVGALLFETLDGRQSFAALLRKGLRMVGSLVLAMVAYLLLTRFLTRDMGMADYMGLSEMGHLSLSELPSLIAESYQKCYTFFWDDNWNIHFPCLKYCFVFTVLGALILFVFLLQRERSEPLRMVLAVVLLILYPLAADIIYVMAPQDGASLHLLTVYGVVFLPVLTVALADYTWNTWSSGNSAANGKRVAKREVIASPMETNLKAVISWGILLSMALTAYSYALADNKAYFKMELSHQQCTAYSIRLLTAIEQAEGYRRGMQVALVGNETAEERLVPTPELNDVFLTGSFNLANYRSCYTYNLFLRNYLGFPDPVYLDGSDLVTQMAALPQVQAMPLYPEAGSVQVINDVVVVKLN